jgi:hypothetical protein
MTRDEATALVYQTEGRLCVSFYRRSDGTILTENCPVGLRSIKRRAAWLAQFLLGMLVTALSAVGLSNLITIRKPLHITAGGIADRYIPSEEPEKSALIVTSGVLSRPPAKKVKTLIQKRKANAKRQPKL